MGPNPNAVILYGKQLSPCWAECLAQLAVDLLNQIIFDDEAYLCPSFQHKDLALQALFL